jgi:hypothetical protein
LTRNIARHLGREFVDSTNAVIHFPVAGHAGYSSCHVQRRIAKQH